MKTIALLTWKSINNRRASALLTVFTVAISMLLLLGVERIRTQAKDSFANTISNTDLIVGARSGEVNLLLYSVFRIGNPTNNIDWQSYQQLASEAEVKWSIPISLGDSHRGFRVMGTNTDYFRFYQYGNKQALQFDSGQPFAQLFDTVIGAHVARKLGYTVGSKIITAHGISDKFFPRHDNLPFKVVGILAATGTPVDKTVHLSLAAIEALHSGWNPAGSTNARKKQQQANFQPEQITAFMLGLKSKIKTFSLQRKINNYPREPLTAIMPGIALHQLWSMMSIAEQALLAISAFVVVAGLLGMLSCLLTSLQERRREMAILRAMGARPKHIFALLVAEATLITAAGISIGVCLLYLLLATAAPVISSRFGINIELASISPHELKLIAIVLFGGMSIGLIPAFRAYRQSLADGMTIRI
ncbi:MAG: ABC-type antimicrobial peptide transport system permease component [Osedax symbiont Rs2]|nr:MAG: ABC-type antimicrobial peptide transport system permease component [Osedax symbiont Rs2]